MSPVATSLVIFFQRSLTSFRGLASHPFTGLVWHMLAILFKIVLRELLLSHTPYHGPLMLDGSRAPLVCLVQPSIRSGLGVGIRLPCASSSTARLWLSVAISSCLVSCCCWHLCAMCIIHWMHFCRALLPPVHGCNNKIYLLC